MAQLKKSLTTSHMALLKLITLTSSIIIRIQINQEKTKGGETLLHYHYGQRSERQLVAASILIDREREATSVCVWFHVL